MADPNPPKEALAKGDAPWPGNPAFTRKEAGEAKAQGRAPMTPEIAELAFDLCETHKIPMTEALQRLGYTKHALKTALNSDLLRMVQLRAYEQAGGSDELESEVLVGALKAKYVEVAKFEGQITDERSYTDHPTRLAALDRVLEMKGVINRRGRREGSEESGARPMLNVQADANVQINVYFGEARSAAEPGLDK